MMLNILFMSLFAMNIFFSEMSAFFCWSSNWTIFIMLSFESSLYFLDSNQDTWYLFTYWCPIDIVTFVKKTILPLMKYICGFVKTQLAVPVWGYFWVPYSVPLIYVLILLLISQCGYIISLEMRKIILILVLSRLF